MKYNLFNLLAAGCLLGALAACSSSPEAPSQSAGVYTIPQAVEESRFETATPEEPLVKRPMVVSNPPVARWSDRTGLVVSPFGDGGLIDVRGFAPGSVARDPKSGRIFMIPVEKP